MSIVRLETEFAAYKNSDEMRWRHFMERYERDQKKTDQQHAAVLKQLAPLTAMHTRSKAIIWFLGLLIAATASIAAGIDYLVKFFKG